MASESDPSTIYPNPNPNPNPDPNPITLTLSLILTPTLTLWPRAAHDGWLNLTEGVPT